MYFHFSALRKFYLRFFPFIFFVADALPILLPFPFMEGIAKTFALSVSFSARPRGFVGLRFATAALPRTIQFAWPRPLSRRKRESEWGRDFVCLLRSVVVEGNV